MRGCRFYQPHWSAEIHEEWIRNLHANRPDLPLDRLHRTRDLMNRALPLALVTGYEPLIDTLTLPDPDDRHVLATALHSRSPVIVTFNLRHFPNATLAAYGVEAQHPDAFLLEAVGGALETFFRIARQHRARLIHPPKDPAAYIATLRQNHLTQIADLLDQYQDEM